MRKIAYLIVLLVYGLTSSFAWAACADISNATNWSNINTHKIIVYRGSKAIAILDIPYCDIYSSSGIRLDKEYICDEDKIIVSGTACDIRNVAIP
jgi:hypothetical protein